MLKESLESLPLLGQEGDVSFRGGSVLGHNDGSPRSRKGVVSFADTGSFHGGRAGLRVTARQANAANRARRTGWVCIDADGTRSLLHADKRAVIQDLSLNIPIRDMRLLDFNLFSSGKILVRDNAIIFTIEHVRLIITASKVIIPREGYEHHPLSNRYVDLLEEAILEWHRYQRVTEARLCQEEEEGGAGGARLSEDEGSGGWRHDYDVLPFEMVVLEVALKEVVQATTTQVQELESVAMPALDALTHKINPATLERVRKVKTRHQRLLIRCETLRDEMERFLGDDDDMTKMCLTRRRELEQASPRYAGQDGGSSGGLGRAGSHPLHHSSSLNRRSPFARMAAPAGGAWGSPPARSGSGLAQGEGGFNAAAPTPQTSLPPPPPSEEDLVADMEVVENLLESYYMQIDGLYDKVVSLDEYIKDTEEYINIELDASRNKLIRLDIILTAAAFSIAPFNLLAGILGENLVIPPQLTRDVLRFYVLNGVAALLCCSFFYAILRYMRYRRLI
ncbi:MRS6 [Auxenochlorella protothecoides x Auxenochlorella symbiontica]